MVNSNFPYGISVQLYDRFHESTRSVTRRAGTLEIDLGWLVLAFNTRANLAKCFYEDENAFIILDGYLTTSDPLSDIAADLILDDFTFINDLRGSFFICLILPKQKKAYFITDRRNSRTYYSFVGTNGIIISPRIDHIARQSDSGSFLLNVEAAVQYLIRGAFYGKHTLIDSIAKIPAATLLAYENGGLRYQEYWRLKIVNDYDDRRSEADLVEEGFQSIKRSVEQSLARFNSPILFLSGGVDSRILLGTLRNSKLDRDVEGITWGRLPIQNGDDVDIAVLLAKVSGISHRVFEIASGNIEVELRQAILSVDCRVDVVDAPSLSQLWKRLGDAHDAFINGDEWFGWRNESATVAQAIDKVGWWNLDKVSRLADWIVPDHRRSAEASIAKSLQALVSKIQANDPDDVKDSLYYYERIGNLLNGQLISKLPFMDPIQPMLGEDVIDFVSGIPRRYRYDKKLLRLILRKRLPELDKLPFASVKALPTGATLQKAIFGNHDNLLFIDNELFKRQNKLLSAFLDFRKIRAVFDCLKNDIELPALTSSVLQSIPLLWRFAPSAENRVHPMILILRVLALNIYVNQLTNGHSE